MSFRTASSSLVDWKAAQEWERAWWGNCANTFAEEFRQIEEAELMGLEPVEVESPFRYPVIDMGGRSVLDVGGGPCSLLLKCVNLGPGSAVLDPCHYPAWVWDRYHQHGLMTLPQQAERLLACDRWDEVWVMNVLQHVLDPAACVQAARRASAGLVRVFEWLNVPPYAGHPHELDGDKLDSWLGGEGLRVWWSDLGRTAYGGVFVQ